MSVASINPNRSNFMSQVMGRINLDRQIKILQEEGPGDPSQLESVKQQFTALENSIPASERQAIANQISTLA